MENLVVMRAHGSGQACHKARSPRCPECLAYAREAKATLEGEARYQNSAAYLLAQIRYEAKRRGGR